MHWWHFGYVHIWNNRFSGHGDKLVRQRKQSSTWSISLRNCQAWSESLAKEASGSWEWPADTASTPVDSESVSHCHVQLFMTPGTIARRAPLTWNSPGRNTGVGCHSFLQGIFLTQGSNPGLLPYRQILLLSEPPGKPPIDSGKYLKRKTLKKTMRVETLGLLNFGNQCSWDYICTHWLVEPEIFISHLWVKN